MHIFAHVYSLASFVFFFNHTATTEIYTLSLHDALPILAAAMGNVDDRDNWKVHFADTMRGGQYVNNWRMAELHAKEDRKSTRLNSSHSQISYAVFCLKKKKNTKNETTSR